MNYKWAPLEPGEDIPRVCGYGHAVLVTRTINSGKGEPYVDMAHPGWNYANNRVTAYMAVKPPEQDRGGWRSVYWGDGSPEKDGWYLAAVPRNDADKSNIFKLWYSAKDDKWPTIKGREVFAYFPIPKPYRAKT